MTDQSNDYLSYIDSEPAQLPQHSKDLVVLIEEILYGPLGDWHADAFCQWYRTPQETSDGLQDFIDHHFLQMIYLFEEKRRSVERQGLIQIRELLVCSSEKETIKAQLKNIGPETMSQLHGSGKVPQRLSTMYPRKSFWEQDSTETLNDAPERSDGNTSANRKHTYGPHRTPPTASCSSKATRFAAWSRGLKVETGSWDSRTSASEIKSDESLFTSSISSEGDRRDSNRSVPSSADRGQASSSTTRPGIGRYGTSTLNRPVSSTPVTPPLLAKREASTGPGRKTGGHPTPPNSGVSPRRPSFREPPLQAQSSFERPPEIQPAPLPRAGIESTPARSSSASGRQRLSRDGNSSGSAAACTLPTEGEQRAERGTRTAKSRPAKTDGEKSSNQTRRSTSSNRRDTGPAQYATASTNSAKNPAHRVEDSTHPERASNRLTEGRTSASDQRKRSAKVSCPPICRGRQKKSASSAVNVTDSVASRSQPEQKPSVQQEQRPAHASAQDRTDKSTRRGAGGCIRRPRVVD